MKFLSKIACSLLFLLFMPETQAMPRKPQANQVTEKKWQTPPRVQINGKTLKKREKILDYQPNMVFLGPTSNEPIIWFYGYSPILVEKRLNIEDHVGLTALPHKEKTFELDEFKHTKWPNVGYHYFAYKFQNNLSGYSLRYIIIKINKQPPAKVVSTPPPLTNAPDIPQNEEEIPSIEGEVPLTIKLHTPQMPYGGTKAYYWIENLEPGTIVNPPLSGYDELGWFENGLEVSLTFPTPGMKTVYVKYGNQISTYNMIARVPLIPLAVLLNANDSNANHKPDYGDEPFPANPLLVDPEVIPMDLFYNERITYNPPWELEKNDFFETYAGHKLRLSNSPGIKIWPNQTRDHQAVLEMTITPEYRDSILKWLSTNIYVEGVQASARDGQETITLELLDPTGKSVKSITWPITVLHLYVNHDKNKKEKIDSLKKNAPVHEAVNPAVIVIDPMEENDTNGIYSWFEVDSSNLKLLEKYKRLIEWRIEGETPETGPIIVSDPELSNNSWLTRGLKMGVQGWVPTTARIGIRIAGMNADYISFRKEVVNIRQIPVALHFFTDKREPEFLAKIALIKEGIETILPWMNIIGRQAGIEFELKKATPEDQIVNCMDDLYWEGTGIDFSLKDFIKFDFEQTLSIVPNPFTKGSRIVFYGLNENKKVFYRGSIKYVRKNTATGSKNEIFHLDLSNWDGKKYTLHPDLLLEEENQFQTVIESDSFIHSGIQSWALSRAGAFYYSAIASVPNAVNINFVNDFVGHQHNSSELSGAASPYQTPTHSFLSEEKDNITMTTYFEYNLISKLGSKNIRATLFTMQAFIDNMKQSYGKGYPKIFVHRILQTLGIQNLGVTRDLRHYSDNNEKEIALRENILIERNGLLMINPISPCTDHSVLPPDYETMNLFQDQNIVIAPKGGHDVYFRYNINAAQAAILHGYRIIGTGQ